MIQYEPHTLKERLAVLYTPEDAANAYEGLKTLISDYRERIASQPYQLSEKDAILITYGDQVQHPPEPPLKELSDFLIAHIDGLFIFVFS